jgi:uracil-DNA glycosylase
VRRGAAHSHKGKGWENFTDAVIRELNDRKSGLVFLLWGKPAQVTHGPHPLVTRPLSFDARAACERAVHPLGGPPC